MFILILGHGRSGTNLCAGLLNQVPGINIGYEQNNGKIAGLDFLNNVINEKIRYLPNEFTGNKIVIYPEISLKNFMHCYDNGAFIFNNRMSDVRVIFTKRNFIDTVLSENVRINAKREIKQPMSYWVERYIQADKILRKLKMFFKNYHVFDFDKALGCELHRKWLFDFVDQKYLSFYSESYKGVHNYVYGSLDRVNAIHSNKEKYVERRKEIREIFEQLRYWPNQYLREGE